MISQHTLIREPLRLGRYSLYAELASGGMATVYLARMAAPGGFGRMVAVKRLHRHLSRDPEIVSMFVDEARVAARVAHTNVVPILDVVTSQGELFLVLEYVAGESLSRLLKASHPTPPPVAVTVAILVDALNGLQAAHEAKDEQGEPLSIVHRDVSPQNILVGADGVARVLDFGVAKAVNRLQTTREGQLKGKLAYMAPEQILGDATHRTDVYAASVVLWESLACQRLFQAPRDRELIEQIQKDVVVRPSEVNPAVPAELDRIALKGLSRDPRDRFESALEMARALDAALRPASTTQVARWLESLATAALRDRAALVSEVEHRSERDSASAVKRLVDGVSARPESSSSLPPVMPVAGAEVPHGEVDPLGPTKTLIPPVGHAPRTWATGPRLVALAGALVAVAVGGVRVATSRVDTTASHPPPAAPSPSSQNAPSNDTSDRAPASSPPSASSRPPPLAASVSPPSPRAEEPSRSGPQASSKPHAATPVLSPSAKPPVNNVKSPEEILSSPTILDQH